MRGRIGDFGAVFTADYGEGIVLELGDIVRRTGLD